MGYDFRMANKVVTAVVTGGAKLTQHLVVAVSIFAQHNTLTKI